MLCTQIITTAQGEANRLLISSALSSTGSNTENINIDLPLAWMAALVDSKLVAACTFLCVMFLRHHQNSRASMIASLPTRSDMALGGRFCKPRTQKSEFSIFTSPVFCQEHDVYLCDSPIDISI